MAPSNELFLKSVPKNEVELVLAIVGLALEYGVPAVTSALAALDKKQITLEDIQGLRGLVKPPETY